VGDRFNPRHLRLGHYRLRDVRDSGGRMFHTAPPAIVDRDVLVGDGVALVDWSSAVMMPVGTDPVWTGQRRARWCGGQRVEVSGFGDAAAALGFDVLGPGDALPVAGAASSGEFAGLQS